MSDFFDGDKIEVSQIDVSIKFFKYKTNLTRRGGFRRILDSHFNKGVISRMTHATITFYATGSIIVNFDRKPSQVFITLFWRRVCLPINLIFLPR